MIQNYFKIAWRNLSRNKGFTFTNLLGLTIGITCTMFIYLWVQDELTFDKFHKNYNQVYQVIANRNFDGQVMTDPSMVFPLAPALKSASAQIENAVVTTTAEPHLLSAGAEKRLKKKGYIVSAGFFNVFSYHFISGNPATAIADPSSMVLTSSGAKALFGIEDVLNKTVQIDNDQNYKVSAVIKDPPGNSTFQFDYVIPFNYSNDYIVKSMSEWSNSSWNVYLQVKPGTNMVALNKNINAVKKQHSPDDKVSTYFTFPMSKWHLYSEFKNGVNTGGMIEYVRLFSVIGIIILSYTHLE